MILYIESQQGAHRVYLQRWKRQQKKKNPEHHKNWSYRATCHMVQSNCFFFNVSEVLHHANCKMIHSKKYVAQGRLDKPSSMDFNVGRHVQEIGRRCEIMWQNFQKQSLWKRDIFTNCLYDSQIDAFYFTSKKYSQSNTRLCLMHYSSKQNFVFCELGGYGLPWNVLRGRAVRKKVRLLI